MSDIQPIATETQQPPARTAWSWYKKFGFRILFIFFILMSLPTGVGWYKNVISINWLRPHYRDIYDIARFQPGYRALFTGRNGYDDGDGDTPGGGNNNNTGEGKNRRNRDSTGKDTKDTSLKQGQLPERFVNTGTHKEGFKKHRHGGDSTQPGHRDRNLADNGSNAGNGGFKRHHHRDSTQAGNDDHSLAGGGNEASNSGFRRRHHRDSTQAGNDDRNWAGSGDGAGNGGFKRHHHRDSTRTSNSDESSNNFASRKEEHPNEGFKRHHRQDVAHTDSATAQIASPDKDTARKAGFAAASTGGNGGGNNDTNGAGGPGEGRQRSFLGDYTDWGIVLLIAIAGALIWTPLDRKRKEYHTLYYWLRVVVRYRAGIGIIGFGFTKLFPTQMPYPSLGLLNSDFGDFTSQKIYWMSVGIVPWYQVFGGIVEIAAGTMLFFRRTTTFGALLLAGALGDITYVNYAYDGGVHVYAFYFVLLSLFLLADDLPGLYRLLIKEQYTVPVRYYPDFSKPWLRFTRIGLKSLTFLIFFIILFYTEVMNFTYDPYKQPSTAGVVELRGNYAVTEFRLNNQVIPYSPLDSIRWQEATFEKWTTLTFKVNKPNLLDLSNGGGSPMKDIQRTFEITGVAGGQRAFHYYADTIDQVLYLQDKNAVASRRGRGGRGGGNKENKPQDNWISTVAWQHIGDEKTMIDKRALSTRRDREFAQKAPESPRNRMILHYSTVDGAHVILTGVNENKDSIYVVLDRINKKYTLPESSLSAGSYN